MLLVAVTVNSASGMMQNGAPTTSVFDPAPPTMPTVVDEPQAVIALVPVMWNSGPDGSVAPATEATAAVTPGGASTLKNPGTQEFVIDEHNHWFPVFRLIYGVNGWFVGVQAPDGLTS